AEVTHWALRRGLFTPAPGATALGTGPACYPTHAARGSQHEELVRAAQGAMLALEVTVSEQARQSTVDDDLLVTDGPLRGRHQLPRTLGYIKRSSTTYLPPALARVVNACRAGERSPVFRLGPRWPHYSWYLRLPGPVGAPGTGIVRVQCS